MSSSSIYKATNVFQNAESRSLRLYKRVDLLPLDLVRCLGIFFPARPCMWVCKGVFFVCWKQRVDGFSEEMFCFCFTFGSNFLLEISVIIIKIKAKQNRQRKNDGRTEQQHGCRATWVRRKTGSESSSSDVPAKVTATLKEATQFESLIKVTR
jgi:hypothetical protein